MTIELLVTLEQGQSWPQFNFNSPSKLITQNNLSLYSQDQLWEIDISDSQFALNYTNKSSNETVLDSDGKIIRDQTLEISLVWYQGIKLNLNILSRMAQYYPDYRSDFIDYCQINNITLESGPLHQLKFWHAGSWILDLRENFWYRYANEKKSNKYINTDSDIENFIGASREEIARQLISLKKLLT
jgi:hypothetical protein